jgi:hypothetical protein
LYQNIAAAIRPTTPTAQHVPTTTIKEHGIVSIMIKIKKRDIEIQKKT